MKGENNKDSSKDSSKDGSIRSNRDKDRRLPAGVPTKQWTGKAVNECSPGEAAAEGSSLDVIRVETATPASGRYSPE